MQGFYYHKTLPFSCFNTKHTHTMPNQISPNTKRVTFCVDKSDYTKIERLASESGLNTSELIREALWEYVVKNQDSEFVQLRRSPAKSKFVRDRYKR